ncbi:MAG: DUF4440 domain-containing protein [Clostridia bacterium]|nr:DUF4440 domain-containing protein [Clostridia bacterium]
MIKEHLHVLEQRLLQPEVRSSVKDLEILAADDFMEFGSSGKVYNKEQVIDVLSSLSPVHMILTDFQVKLLSPGMVLTTYLVGKLSDQGEETKYSLRSSIWRFKGGKWQIIFHQGTPKQVP